MTSIHRDLARNPAFHAIFRDKFDVMWCYDAAEIGVAELKIKRAGL